MKNKEIDIAWAAGFFEGEGSVYCWSYRSNNKEYKYLRAKAGQNEREPLDKLVQILGGKVYGPYPKNYIWTISGKNAEKAMSLIEPYLFSRRLSQLEKAREKAK